MLGSSHYVTAPCIGAAVKKKNVKLKESRFHKNRRVWGGIKDSILLGSEEMSWTHNLK